MRVLVVEDERPLADAIATGLRREGVAVDVAYDGTSAEHRLVVNDYDVVVLDRDLPGCTGTMSAAGWSRTGRPRGS
jgi:DNA-binding response OmpR family regulator